MVGGGTGYPSMALREAGLIATGSHARGPCEGVRTAPGVDSGRSRRRQMAVASTFAGFPPEGIQFMADLAANNDRTWFQPRKGEYERLVKEPMELLMVALAERFEARGIPLVADPKRSPFRIYRDTRFSRDKSPYKTHIGASMPWVEGSADGAPTGEAGAERSGEGRG